MSGREHVVNWLTKQYTMRNSGNLKGWQKKILEATFGDKFVLESTQNSQSISIR